MMLPAGVVQSIDANIVDLDNAWIFADQDIWSQDYAEVLLQPISVEAVDINDLRFKATEVVLEIRGTTDPASAVIWSGYAETVDDAGGGGVVGLESRISCGVIDPVPPVFVDNGNGTASIFGFRCAIRPVPDYTQSPSDFEIAPATLSFVNNTESYVCVRYNSGAPVMYVETNQANINGSDVVLIFVVWRTGNELHSVSTDSRGIGLADKIAGMITRTKPYSLMHGQQLTLGVVTTPAVRTVTIAAATIYAGVDAIPLTALNSSNPAQRFTRVAPTAGVYGFLNQTQLDNTNYSDGINVVALGANRYSPRWVYRTVGDDVQAFYVLGNEYSNIASAQAAPLPTGLPLVVQEHAVLVGRIIVQNGIDTPVQIDQVVSTTFSTSTANMHNNLDGLQGTGPDYYHMDVTRWTNTGDGPWLPLTAGVDKPLTGTLYGTAGAEFGGGALVLVQQGSGSTLSQTYTRGGDLSLAGDSGRANMRIMGSIQADTAGVGPGLSFAGVSTGVGPTGGGMLMQLATNNGLDIYSWNNSAWVKKSQINAAGMIAVVGGTSSGFLKANGTIDTTGYLTSINPTYTGRLTGPEQYLENDGQILLAIRRPGGNSGRIHGIAFQAQTLNGTWAEFGRVMTYISSVADGAQIGGMRLYAYDAGTIVQALDAGPTGVTFAGLLSGPRATLTEFGTMAAMPGDSNYATLHATGVTRTSTNYALRLADDGTNTLVNASSDVALAIAGTAKLGVTTSNVNLGSGVSLSFNGTTVIDSSRNATLNNISCGNIVLNTTAQEVAILRRPGATTNLLWGLDYQGQTADLTWVNYNRLQSRIVSATNGAWSGALRVINYNAGTAQITAEFAPTAVNFASGVELQMQGSRFVDTNKNVTMGATLTLNTLTSTQANIIIRNSTEYWTSFYTTNVEAGFRDYNAEGSANSYPIYWTLKAGGLLRITRPTNFMDALRMSGTQFLDTSRNASFASVAVDQHGSVSGTMAGSESWRVIGRQIATNDGYLEIATEDANTISPIYVKQYTGTFASPTFTRTLTLLDISGNSVFPGVVTATAFSASANGTGENYRVGDDLWIGDINASNTAQLKGFGDATKAYLKFGTSGPVVGYDGSIFQIPATVNISSFGVFRRHAPSSTTSSGLYPTGVTPASNNYVLFFTDTGTSTQVNGSTEVILNTTNIQRIKVTSAGLDLVNSSTLYFNGAACINSNREATFKSMRTINTYGDCGVSTGNGDAATYSTYNISVDSWYGIGFKCAYDNTVRLVMNTRTGDLSVTGTVSAPNLIANAYTSNGDFTFSNSGTIMRGIKGTVGDNDFWRIVGGASAANAGFLEISTADDGTEPIYVRQYNGTFGSIARQVTLLDEYGNSTFCGSVVAYGDWIQAVGANTKGRFKSQFSGNKASYIGNWPASNWWGIGSDGSTTGTSGVIKVGQCDGDGAWVVNGIQMYVLGQINVAQTGVFGSSITAASASLSPGVDGSGPVLTIDRGGASQAMTRGLKLSCNSSVIGNANPRIELADGSSVMSIDNYGQSLRLYASTVVGSATVMLSGNAAGMTFGVPTRLNERIADITSVPSTVTLAAGMSEIIYMSTANQTLTLNTDTATIGYAWDICVLAAGCTLNTSSTPRAIYYNGSAYSQTNMALTQYKMYRLVKVTQNGYFLLG